MLASLEGVKGQCNGTSITQTECNSFWVTVGLGMQPANGCTYDWYLSPCPRVPAQACAQMAYVGTGSTYNDYFTVGQYLLEYVAINGNNVPVC